jgi:hypothetical protein
VPGMMWLAKASRVAGQAKRPPGETMLAQTTDMSAFSPDRLAKRRTA